MKLIGLDVGTKRIGVAKADSAVRIAVPYAAIEVDGTEFDKIASLARAWDINSFVIGLPRNAQGQETEQSQYSRRFAAALKQAIPSAKICFQDESLTSVEAEKRLKGRKKAIKKATSIPKLQPSSFKISSKNTLASPHPRLPPLSINLSKPKNPPNPISY